MPYVYVYSLDRSVGGYPQNDPENALHNFLFFAAIIIIIRNLPWRIPSMTGNK